MVTDVLGRLNEGIYKFHGNNAMFMFSTADVGKGVAHAYRFASMPNESEATGPTWVGEDTLFLCIQHPGEYSESAESPTSHWPLGGDSPPYSGVVAIVGSFGNNGPFGTSAFYNASKA
jgi:uncharacterized protein